MRVEIVFALPDRQLLQALDVPDDATVAEVVDSSGIDRRFPGVDFASLQAGIWGKPVARDHVVRDGDRVEFYRPLEIDPKEARRLKAGR